MSGKKCCAISWGRVERMVSLWMRVVHWFARFARFALAREQTTWYRTDTAWTDWVCFVCWVHAVLFSVLFSVYLAGCRPPFRWSGAITIQSFIHKVLLGLLGSIQEEWGQSVSLTYPEGCRLFCCEGSQRYGGSWAGLHRRGVLFIFVAGELWK